eukprot:258273_1
MSSFNLRCTSTSCLALLCIVISILLVILHLSTIDVRYYDSLPKWGIYATYTVYYTANAPFLLKYHILSALFDDHNPRNLSIKLRALEDAFSTLKAPVDQKWNGPVDESLFLAIYDRFCNTLSYLVPLSPNTSIRRQLLISHEFTTSLRESLHSKYALTIPNEHHTSDTAILSRVFVPETVQLLWILGDVHVDNSTNARTILYLHGGGYVLCSGASHLGLVSELSVATQIRVLVIWYKKPPHATIPSQVAQTLTTYLYLIESMGVHPSDIIIGGDSAGAGLGVLLLQKLSMLGLYDIYPFGMVLLSPWVDLTLSSDSWKYSDESDIVLDFGYVERCSLMAVGYDTSKLSCPLHSALHNDERIMHKLPNMFVMASRHEALFNDSQNLVNKLRRDCEKMNGSCNIVYEIEEYRPHACPIFLGLFDEAQISFDKVVKVILEWYES